MRDFAKAAGHPCDNFEGFVPASPIWLYWDPVPKADYYPYLSSRKVLCMCVNAAATLISHSPEISSGGKIQVSGL